MGLTPQHQTEGNEVSVNEQAVIAEYNRIAQVQRNNGLTVDHVAICNVIAAKYGYDARSVTNIMEGKKQ